jgi:hypothetical protein
VSACKQAGCPAPEIEQEHNGWWTRFTFRREVVERLKGDISEEGREKTSGKNFGEKTGQNGSGSR